MNKQITRPMGTSWTAVIGGWIAAVGAAALLAPAIAATLSGRAAVANDLALAVPIVVGLMIAYLVGGYVAGRMAGYNTSWHGMMTAFFGLFVTLLAMLLAAAADRGYLASSGVRSLADVFPGIRQLDPQALGDTLTFGAILGFLATIFAAWVGGLVAVDRWAHQVLPAQVVQERVVVREKPSFRLLPSLGRKGGERAETKEEEVKETRVER